MKGLLPPIQIVHPLLCIISKATWRTKQDFTITQTTGWWVRICRNIGTFVCFFFSPRIPWLKAVQYKSQKEITHGSKKQLTLKICDAVVSECLIKLACFVIIRRFMNRRKKNQTIECTSRLCTEKGHNELPICIGFGYID